MLCLLLSSLKSITLINRVCVVFSGDMVDIDFVSQLVDSMESAVAELEQAASSGDNEKAMKLKTFVFDLHSKINDNLLGK